MWGKYGSISIGPLIGRKRPSPLAISLCFPSPSVQKGLEVATQSRNCMHHIFMQLCLAHKVPARKAEWLVTQKGQDLPDARCWNSCSALAHFCVGLKFLFIFCATCFHLSALTNTKLSETKLCISKVTCSLGNVSAQAAWAPILSPDESQKALPAQPDTLHWGVLYTTLRSHLLGEILTQPWKRFWWYKNIMWIEKAGHKCHTWYDPSYTNM